MPGPGEVRVRIAVSGVNPTDWKQPAGARRGTRSPSRAEPGRRRGRSTPSAPGVDGLAVGDRVWIFLAASSGPTGTAQEYVVLPRRAGRPAAGRGVLRPRRQPRRPGADRPPRPDRPRGRADAAVARGAGRRTVLVAGGAGAVGHAAIQLARWAGATVLTTVSGPGKAALAAAAGAHHTVNYREPAAGRGDPRASRRTGSTSSSRSIPGSTPS